MATNMKSLLAPAAFGVLGLLAGCGTAADPVTTKGATPSVFSAATPGAIAAPGTSAVVAGYQHRKEASLFRLGDSVTYLSKQNLSRAIGSEGVFAVHGINGLSISVPNATAKVLSLPPLFDNEDEHNKHTVNYFVQAGIPKDQIGMVKANFEGIGSGSLDELHETTAPIVSGIYTVLTRVVDGISVPESFAYARFAKDGSVAAEGVYWPELSRVAVDEARQLHAAITDPGNGPSLRARMPQGHLQVSIHHSGFGEQVRPTAMATYDVLVLAKDQTPHHQYFNAAGTRINLAVASPTELFEKAPVAPASAVDQVFSP